jgi:DNA-binding response OmpR family regulator
MQLIGYDNGVYDAKAPGNTTSRLAYIGAGWSKNNSILSRIDLLENAWDISFNLGTNVVDVYINYLRKKIDADFEPKLIHTVVGMGYILKEA